MVYVDLHIHTNASDGAFSLEEIAQKAVEKDIKIIAVTDHETVDGLANISEIVQRHNRIIIPAIELGTVYNKKKLDVLGYNIDYKDNTLIGILEDIKRRREDRVKETIEKLNNDGISVTFDEIRTSTDKKYVGYPRLYKILAEKKYADTLNDAHKKYGPGSDYYIPDGLYNIPKLLELIAYAGGISVLAHPYAWEHESFEIESLVKEFNFKGIEVFYPKHNKIQREFLASLAQDYELLVTGGSDFHGNPESKLELGKIVDGHKLKAKEIKDFLKATGRYYK